MGSAGGEGERRSDQWLAVLGNEAELCVSVHGARAAWSSTRVRAPAETLHYCRGYVKHISVVHSPFIQPPLLFFCFTTPWSPHALHCVTEAPPRHLPSLCLFEERAYCPPLPDLNPGCNAFHLATGLWWFLVSVPRYLHWMCMVHGWMQLETDRKLRRRRAGFCPLQRGSLQRLVPLDAAGRLLGAWVSLEESAKDQNNLIAYPPSCCNWLQGWAVAQLW